MQYKSTRKNQVVSASTAILNGIAEGGGLYLPTDMPRLTKSLDELSALSYPSLCFEILKLFYTDFTEAELTSCINAAYGSHFDTPVIAPLVKAGEHYVLELFHGRTSAFKDMALSLHPYLMQTAAKKCNLDQKIIILTATSGDTGKAALEGFADLDGIEIVVIYPQDGVSPIQKLQMTTQEGANTHVAAMKGNFDDTQTAVKQIFHDEALRAEFREKGYIFSSANSINIGRLFPQVVYYFYAYGQMLQKGEIQSGEPIHFCVPTGNFGNLLAGYYAYQMGLPIQNLICASNANHILYDFFQTGTYDTNRPFIVTTSPSMDILISSNLERFLYELSPDPEQITAHMNALRESGVYHFDLPQTNIHAEYANEQEVFSALRSMYRDCGYILDTHTAVAKAAYDKYQEQNGRKDKAILVSTAHPAKFAKAVLAALTNDSSIPEDDFSCIRILENEYHLQIPEKIKQLQHKNPIHQQKIEKDALPQYLSALFLQ